MNAVATDPQVTAALFRSAMYEFLMLAFAYPTEQVRERLDVLVEDLEEFPPAHDSGYLEEARAVAAGLAALPPSSLAPVHNHLFEQSAVCSPFETEYEADPFAKGRQLADIAGFYRAFGMQVSADRPTMTDFLGTELEFMSLLSRKEAYAAVLGWKRRRRVAVEAERSFLRDHLGRWERVICGEITTHAAADAGTGESAYGALARLTTRFVSEDVRRFGVHPLRLKHRMLSSGEPMECPFAQPSDEPSVVEDLAVEHGIPLDPRAPGDDVRP